MAQVKKGKKYLGFLCEKCGSGIPVIEEEPENPVVGVGDTFGVFHLQCLVCKHEADYQPASIRRLEAHKKH